MMLKVRTAVANGILERDYAVKLSAGHDARFDEPLDPHLSGRSHAVHRNTLPSTTNGSHHP